MSGFWELARSRIVTMPCLQLSWGCEMFPITSDFTRFGQGVWQWPVPWVLTKVKWWPQALMHLDCCVMETFLPASWNTQVTSWCLRFNSLVQLRYYWLQNPGSAWFSAFLQQLHIVWWSVSFNSLNDLLLILQCDLSLQDALPKHESREEELCWGEGDFCAHIPNTSSIHPFP